MSIQNKLQNDIKTGNNVSSNVNHNDYNTESNVNIIGLPIRSQEIQIVGSVHVPTRGHDHDHMQGEGEVAIDKDDLEPAINNNNNNIFNKNNNGLQQSLIDKLDDTAARNVIPNGIIQQASSDNINNINYNVTDSDEDDNISEIYSLDSHAKPNTITVNNTPNINIYDQDRRATSFSQKEGKIIATSGNNDTNYNVAVQMAQTRSYNVNAAIVDTKSQERKSKKKDTRDHRSLR